uniref:Vasoactive intestinal polypeptide receptor 2 n=1 Tax=Canis lupus familiaris TaxID=9615 RepID=A0A8P0T1J3_CANLF
MRAPALLPPALLTCCGWLLAPVNSVHPECRFHLEIQEEETKCAELLKTQTGEYKACTGVWDNITCWRPADVGETVTVPCPKVFSNFYSKPGNISKNCTRDGWSEMFPDFIDACGYHDAEDESKITFYILVKAIYTLGYSASLVSLTTGSVILCVFRKLHCTRNYIHLNLFLSFILRAISVLVKDDVLYSSSGTLHCPDQPSSWVGCKLSLVFFQYCIVANFHWLLVEGLHLRTLLVAIFSPGRRLVAYLLIGWGIPTVCIGAWTAARIALEDTGCWDTNDHSVPWWVIRAPILTSIIVNFVLFVSIIRILLQKLTSPDVSGNDQSQYKRLTKSTLLLIPLFGVHYMVFAVFPIGISSKYQILFELCIGSFQGLVVAILYCFLNSEVSVRSGLGDPWPMGDALTCPHPPTGGSGLLLGQPHAVPPSTIHTEQRGWPSHRPAPASSPAGWLRGTHRPGWSLSCPLTPDTRPHRPEGRADERMGPFSPGSPGSLPQLIRSHVQGPLSLVTPAFVQLCMCAHWVQALPEPAPLTTSSGRPRTDSPPDPERPPVLLLSYLSSWSKLSSTLCAHRFSRGEETARGPSAPTQHGCFSRGELALPSSHVHLTPLPCGLALTPGAE